MRRPALLAGLLLTALPASATNWADIQRVEQRIERLGARVIWSRMNTGDCARDGLIGFYQFSKRQVVICQQRSRDLDVPLLETLQHEGWHAVQHLCNRSRAVLSDDKIRKLLSSADKRTLRSNYSKSQHRLEAEARALEHLPVHAYLRGVNHYCP